MPCACALFAFVLPETGAVRTRKQSLPATASHVWSTDTWRHHEINVTPWTRAVGKTYPGIPRNKRTGCLNSYKSSFLMVSTLILGNWNRRGTARWDLQIYNAQGEGFTAEENRAVLTDKPNRAQAALVLCCVTIWAWVWLPGHWDHWAGGWTSILPAILVWKPG